MCHRLGEMRIAEHIQTTNYATRKTRRYPPKYNAGSSCVGGGAARRRTALSRLPPALCLAPSSNSGAEQINLPPALARHLQIHSILAHSQINAPSTACAHWFLQIMEKKSLSHMRELNRARCTDGRAGMVVRARTEAGLLQAIREARAHLP